MPTQSKSKFKKSPDPKKAQATRRAGYERNMALMRAYKESHPCKQCGHKFPHSAMQFGKTPRAKWSIPRLAGARCTVEALQAAMEKTPLYCATCFATVNL